MCWGDNEIPKTLCRDNNIQYTRNMVNNTIGVTPFHPEGVVGGD